MKERAIEIAIRKILDGRSGRVAGECPDENILAAYLEDSLSGDEKTGVEQHASDCLLCQQILALAMKLPGQEQTVTHPPQVASRAGLFPRFLRPLPALAGVLIALMAGTFLYRFYLETPASPEAVRLAELRSAEDQAPVKSEKPIRSESETAPVAPPDAISPTSPLRSQTKPAVLEEVATAGAEKAKETGRAPKREEADMPASMAAAELEKKSDAGDRVAPGTVTKAAALTDAKDRPGPARVGGIRNPDIRTQFRQEAAWRPVTASESIAAVQSALGSSGGEAVVRQVGSRRFYRTDNFWVDEQCLQHAEEVPVEIDPESEIMKQILSTLPKIEELRGTRLPILLYWDNKNCVIR